MTIQVPNFPSNSRKPERQDPSEETKPAAEEKKVTKIITGTAIKKKKNWLERAGESLGVADGDSVWNYVFWDVIVPGAKDVISNVFISTVEMFFYGETRGRPAKGITRDKTRSFVSYGDMFDKGDRRPVSRRPEIASRNRSKVDDIIIDDRREAEEVLSEMADLLEQFEVVSVAEFLDLVGITPEHTDYKWGWYSLRDGLVRRVQGGYIISLPRPELLR